jgi:hypothetical protein
VVCSRALDDEREQIEQGAVARSTALDTPAKGVPARVSRTTSTRARPAAAVPVAPTKYPPELNPK